MLMHEIKKYTIIIESSPTEKGNSQEVHEQMATEKLAGMGEQLMRMERTTPDDTNIYTYIVEAMKKVE